MLAQLNKVNGVEESFANRSGMLFRASVSQASDVDTVAKDLREVLSARTRSPTRVTGPDLEQALKSEEWRDADRINELSAIEYHTLTIRSSEAFAKEEHLNGEQTGRLMKSVEEVWSELAKEISTELRKDRGKRKWQPIYDRFDAAMRKRTGGLLTADQMDRLMESLQSKL